MNNRQKAAHETKKKLLVAGEKLFAEKGFDNISVEDITRECKLAKGTFYIYFRHKEDLIREIGRVPFEKIEEELFQMRNHAILERLKHYFILFMDGVEKFGINICRQWIRNVVTQNRPSEFLDKQKYLYDTDMLTRILQEEVTRGVLHPDTPLKDLSFLIIAEFYGMMLCWCMSDGKLEPKEQADVFVSVFLKPLLMPYLTKGELE